MLLKRIEIIPLEQMLQGTEDWHNSRLGRVTASGFVKLMSNESTRQKYIYSKAAEIITGTRSDSDCNVKNVHIERGYAYEDIARKNYIVKNFQDVKQVGIILLGDYASCSPDGLVDDDGMIEIKCCDNHVFLEKALDTDKQEEDKDKICKEHYYQMQFNLFLTGRKWCDYVLYNPRYPKHQSLFIHRVYRNDSLDIENKLMSAVHDIQLLVSKFNKVMERQNECL